MIESRVLGPKTGPERRAGYQTNFLPTTAEPCGLCTQPSPLSLFYFKHLHSAPQVDTDKSTCLRLSAWFSYAKAKQVTLKSPCGNVPICCPCCPKNAPGAWKYNLAHHITTKHAGAQIPTEY